MDTKTRSEYSFVGGIALLVLMACSAAGCSSETTADGGNKNEHEAEPVHFLGALQFGSGYDSGLAIATDATGRSWVTGYTTGDLAGTGHNGRSDIFVAQYDSLGAQLWIRQIGTAADDEGNGIAVDAAGNSYVTGYTEGDLGGGGNAGQADLFIAKLDPVGNTVWIRQFGTLAFDKGTGIAADAFGNSCVGGATYGNLGGTGNAGSADIFVAKFDGSGQKVWVRQFGTGGDDVFVVKYTITGDFEWIKQFGSDGNDTGRRIGLDTSGNLYVSGTTDGDIGGTGNAGGDDVFVAKLDQDGNVLWIRQFRSAGDDRAAGIAIHPFGDTFITGMTDGDLGGDGNAGSEDAFLAKLDSDGNTVWVRQFGTSAADAGTGVVADPFGDVTVTGTTAGILAGEANAGASDAFVGGYDGDGNLVWIEQIGTPFADVPLGVALDSDGYFDIAGYTAGDLSGEGRAGGEDVFFARFLP